MTEHATPSQEATVVYVITDLDEPATEDQGDQGDPREALRGALRQMLGLAVIGVPVLATTALVIGLFLGWPPLILLLAAALALPVLVNLIDLAGAFIGAPPMSWTVKQLARHGRKEKHTHG
ncbi:hypothetical protein [Streptosporangium minutum]|uniref:Uncharacterized protein n=1 Tax=Streptosporangium minutum TaxID=569862 RepID=A0A243RY18_9ACTN|nr:hypothetical protein [Streptosporangium minutum]OUD00093.1 hypothetical protein CA984_00175 [Streptosporangium minutum]